MGPLELRGPTGTGPLPSWPPANARQRTTTVAIHLQVPAGMRRGSRAKSKVAVTLAVTVPVLLTLPGQWPGPGRSD